MALPLVCVVTGEREHVSYERVRLSHDDQAFDLELPFTSYALDAWRRARLVQVVAIVSTLAAIAFVAFLTAATSLVLLGGGLLALVVGALLEVQVRAKGPRLVGVRGDELELELPSEAAVDAIVEARLARKRPA